MRAGAAIAALLLAASGASAQNGVLFSPDITANLGTVLPTVVTDESLAFDNSAGSVLPLLPAIPLPPQIEVAGLDLLPTGEFLLAVDVTVALPGLPVGMPAEPRDVVSFDYSTGLFTLVFDGSAAAVPANARIDAVATDAAGDLLLSFDTSVLLGGVGAVDDEDVVVFSGGVFAMVFDGSANGVAAGLDLDGAHRVAGADELQISFDGSGMLAGIPFDDEDVLSFDLVLTTYAMYADSSLSDPVDWPAADLVALPEPGGAASLLAGAALLLLLAGRRRRSSAATRRMAMTCARLLRFTALGSAALFAVAPAARAVDGVNEINDTSIVAAGGYPFTIAASGSYVLTGNLVSPGAPALVVAAADVVIDLNGFEISGAGAAAPGIFSLPPAVGLTVRNGTITGFGGPGILANVDLKLFDTRITGNGAGVVGASACLVVENVITGNAGVGLGVRRCKVENNVITDNGDSGITGEQNVIVHNVIAGNGFGGAGGGVLSFMGSTIQENEIVGNFGFGVSDTPGAPPGPVFAPPLIPFPVGPFPGMPPQVVMKNVINGSPGGIGIYIASSANISDNAVSNNFLDGIVCGLACTVRGNSVSNNNGGVAGNGGITVGPGSAVNANSVSANTGIGAVLDPAASYTSNTLNANTIQDMSLFVPAAALPPHPTSGFFNLCSGVPGPAPGLCP